MSAAPAPHVSQGLLPPRPPAAEPTSLGRVAFILHKPPRCLCSTVDRQPKPAGHSGGERATVYDVLRSAGFPTTYGCVGRLDYETTGLLLFTTDARLNQAIRDRDSGVRAVEKVYTLAVAGRWHAADLAIERLAQPLDCGAGRTTEAAEVAVLRRRPLNEGEPDPWPWPPHGGWVTVLRVVIRDGRNRQIRRLCTRSGLHVHALHRRRVGPLVLGGAHRVDELSSGSCRWLEPVEVDRLYNHALGRLPSSMAALVNRGGAERTSSALLDAALLDRALGDVLRERGGSGAVACAAQAGLLPYPEQDATVDITTRAMAYGLSAGAATPSRVNRFVVSLRHAPVLHAPPLGFRSHLYLALNKPRGAEATRTVGGAKRASTRTIYDVLCKCGAPALPHVGRLDVESEGLLLLTDDTVLASALLSASPVAAAVEKEYIVQVRKSRSRCGGAGADTQNMPVVGSAQLESLGSELMVRSRQCNEARVVQVLGKDECPKAATESIGEEATAWLRVVITQGRNRQVRRLCGRAGLDVLTLRRVRVGPVLLGPELESGRVRSLTQDEVAACYYQVFGAAAKSPRALARGQWWGAPLPDWPG